MQPFSDVAAEVAPYVGDSGTCPDDPIIKDEVNNARRILYRLGDWKGTVTDLVIQAYNGTITLPASFSHLIKAHYAVRKMVIENEWFYVVTTGIDDLCGGICKPIKMNEPVVTFRDFNMEYPEWCDARIEVQFESDREAPGLEIVLHGYSRMGMRVRLPRAHPGPGFTGVTETPVIDQYVRTLYAVNKPATDGRILVFAYHPDTTRRLLVGFYEGGDVNPQLQRYRISYRSDKRSQFLVTAKKKFRPIVDDSEPVDINTDALIHTLQAITSRKSRNIVEYNANLQLATGYLNRELGDEESREQGRIKLTGSFGENTNLTDGDWY